MKRTAQTAAIASFLALASLGAAQTAAKPAATPAKPPELTKVSGRLMLEKDVPTTGGTVFFVFQKRISEIPADGSLERVREMAEAVAGVDKEGSFTLEMAPGNFLLVYDPFTDPTPEVLKPGPDSQAVVKKLTREQIQKRIDLMKQTNEKGLAVVDGALPGGFVIENRLVRPPITEFGDMILGEINTVKVTAKDQAGKPIDFPADLKLRGKNGDIYESHPTSLLEPGVYLFADVAPQRYDVIGRPTKPEPGAGEQMYMPLVKDAAFIYEGKPLEHSVVVTREVYDEEAEARKNAPPPAAPKR